MQDEIYDVNYFTDIKSDYPEITLKSLGFDSEVCMIFWGNVQQLMLANVQSRDKCFNVSK